MVSNKTSGGVVVSATRSTNNNIRNRNRKQRFVTCAFHLRGASSRGQCFALSPREPKSGHLFSEQQTSSQTQTDLTETSATSSKVNLSLNAPSCPIHLNLEREGLSSNDGTGLPLEVRRLAGDFIDSEECSAVPQGWWRWWKYQGL